jgi:hypothetical protein
MLDSRAVNGNHKFGHRPYFGGKFVGAEFGNRKRYSLVKGFRLNFNIMRDAVGIGKRDPAAVHGSIIALVSPFVRHAIYSGPILKYVDEIEQQAEHNYLTSKRDGAIAKHLQAPVPTGPVPRPHKAIAQAEKP